MSKLHKTHVDNILERLGSYFGTITEAAFQLGISRNQLYTYDRQHAIPTRRIIQWRQQDKPLEWLDDDE